MHHSIDRKIPPDGYEIINFATKTVTEIMLTDTAMDIFYPYERLLVILYHHKMFGVIAMDVSSHSSMQYTTLTKVQRILVDISLVH